MNLLEETLKALDNANKSPEHVLWVGLKDVRTDWNNFTQIAICVNYDDGYGAQEIADDLVIVGDNWWLERMEYDGSEWWEFKEKPSIPCNLDSERIEKEIHKK